MSTRRLTRTLFPDNFLRFSFDFLPCNDQLPSQVPKDDHCPPLSCRRGNGTHSCIPFFSISLRFFKKKFPLIPAYNSAVASIFHHSSFLIWCNIPHGKVLGGFLRRRPYFFWVLIFFPSLNSVRITVVEWKCYSEIKHYIKNYIVHQFIYPFRCKVSLCRLFVPMCQLFTCFL